MGFKEGLGKLIGFGILFCLIIFGVTLIGVVVGALIGLVISYIPILNTLLVGGINAFGFSVAVSDLPAICAVLGLIGGFIGGTKYSNDNTRTTDDVEIPKESKQSEMSSVNKMVVA